MARKISYNSRNFADIRSDLVGYIKSYYPDLFSDFNDASVGMMLIEICSGVGDMLSYHTDRMFNETQISYAQERSSILELARTFGLNIPGKKPSMSIVDWSVVIPKANGDTFNLSYAPIIFKGSQASGAGKIFELQEDCDFSSPFTVGGIPNRLIIPNIDSNGQIQSYTLTKREIVLNGTTKIFKKVITQQDSKPFLEVMLPDSDVLSIESIITLEGTDFTSTPTLDDFEDFDNKFHEVEALAQAQIFYTNDDVNSDRLGVTPGRWINITKRFIKEFTDNGFCKIIFGSGESDISSLNEFVGCRGQIDQIGKVINNFSLGEIPKAGHTMYVKYRTGGGFQSNVGPNVLTNKGIVNIRVLGDDSSINTAVRNSLRINNPIPALGGKDMPSIEEIRNLVRYNFSSQNRCVTIKDYQSRVGLMPGKFGVPFRYGVVEEKNKIVVSILGIDESGKLTNESITTLQQNIAEYLSDYRMINDFVNVKDGQIINIGFEVDLFVDKSVSKLDIINNVVETIRTYMDINDWDMGQNVYLSQLVENVNNVGGVLNIIDLRVYNNVGGGKYSINTIAQPLLDETTGQIDLMGQYTLFGQSNAMFEIKYAEKDIRVRIKESGEI